MQESQTQVSPAPAPTPTPQPQPKKHPLRSFLISVLIIAVFAAVGSWLIQNEEMIRDELEGRVYAPSEEVSKLVQSLDLTQDGMRIMKASLPQLQESDNFNANCPAVDAETSVLGCYYDRKLYIYAVNNSDLEGVKESTLAHEFLHAVWDRYEDQEIANELDYVYAQNQDELSEHMKHYSEETRIDELHSIIGTQLPDEKLSDKLLAHYAKYFNNRAKIVQFYQNYDTKIKEAEAYSRDLREQIDLDTEEVNRLIANYEKAVSSLNADINTFNSRAYNGYYHNSAEFTRDRDALVSRQTQIENDYDYIQEKIDSTNELIEEYNKSVNYSSGLYQSLNSQITAPSEALEE